MPTMSNNNGPSTCRRLDRSRNISESSESSWLSLDSKNAASSTRQQHCLADSGSPLDNNSPDRVKRKKRRKNIRKYNGEEQRRFIMKRNIEPRRQKLDKELIKAKLKDNRIPVVLLTRINEGYRPKLTRERKEEKEEDKEEKEEKIEEKEDKREEKEDKQEEREEKKEETKEERIKLPVGVTIPAKIDPKILRRGPIVKINKRHTESLIEVSKRRLQKQSKTEARNDEQGQSSGLVTDSVKCAERLAEKLDNCLSDDNKCTKNQIVNNSSRRHTRISVDKNNDRLPEKVHESDSKCTLNLITEECGSQPESSKNFVSSNRRLKRYSIDQSNDKHSKDLVQRKPKTNECHISEKHEEHSEDFNKDIKKYSKNLSKDIEKHSDNVIDKNHEKHSEISGESDQKFALLSAKENSESKLEISHDKNKKVSKNTRPKRNLSNKNNEKVVSDSGEDIIYKNSLEQHTENISAKLDKIIQCDSKRTGSHKMVRRNTVDKSTGYIDNATENGMDSIEKSINEISNKKITKKFGKKVDECSKTETESSKKVTKKVDDKAEERHSDNFIDKSVNFVENFVKRHNNLEEKIKRSTRNTSDRNVKDTANTQEVRVNCTQNVVKEDDKYQSQTVDENIQKCSRHSIEISENVKTDAEKSINFVENNSEKNFNNKVKEVKDVSVNSTHHFVEETNTNFSKHFNDKLKKVLKIPIEKRLKKSAINKCNEKFTETSIKCQSDPTSLTRDIKNPTDSDKDNERISENNFERNQRSRRKLIRKNCKTLSNDLMKDSLTKIKNCVEQNDENPTENLNQNINSHPASCLKISKRTTRKSTDKKIDSIENQESVKNDEMLCTDKSTETVPQNLNANITENSKIQTETKRGRKKSLGKSLDDTLENSLEKSEEKLPEEPLNVKKCKKNQTENKIVKRQTFNKKEKHNFNSIESDSDFIQSSNQENKEKLPEEFDRNVEENSEIAVEHNKRISRKLSEKNERQPENIIENNLNSIKDGSKEFCKTSYKNIKDIRIQTENKMVTRTSLSNKDVGNSSKKKCDCEQKSINKNAEKIPEESLRIVKECSKSQTENHKKVIRKSSSDKNERLNENVTIYDSNESECSVNKTEKENSENSQKIQKENVTLSDADGEQHTVDKREKSSVESQPIIKDFSKSQTENNKRVTRKSSPNKYNRNNDNLSVSNSDSTQYKFEKAEDIDKSQTTIKEHFKIQTEIHHEKASRKSLPDKQDRHTNNCIMNSEENVNEENEIERLDNKENAKIQVEINARVTRNAHLRKDRSQKNLIENNLDSVQTLVEEKSSEHTENDVKMISKNLSESKKLRKNSVEKMNELLIDDLDKTDTASPQTFVEEVNQPENLNQSCKNHQHDFNENNKTTTRKLSEKSSFKQSQNIETVQSISEDSSNLIEDSTVKVSENSSTNLVENSQKVTRKSFEKLSEKPNDNLQNIQNLIPEFNESEMQLENDRQCLTPMNEPEVTNSQNIIEPDEAENSNENSKICFETISDDNEREILDSAVEGNDSDFLNKNEEHNKVLVVEKDENIVIHTEESPIRCSKRLALKAALKHDETQLEHFENVLDDMKHLITIVDKNQSENLNQNDKNSICQSSDSPNIMSYESIVMEAIESQANTIREDNEIINQISISKDNIQSVVKLIDGIQENQHQNLEENENSCSYKLLDDSENLNHDLFCNMSTDFVTDIALENDLGYSNEDSANEKIFQNSINELDETVSSLFRNPENAIIENAIIENALSNDEMYFQVATEDNIIPGLDDIVADEDSLAKQRRQITLMELKKKCTENLDKRRAATVEQLQDESTECPLSVINGFEDNTNTDLIENTENLDEPLSDSCPENATESETGVESLDSDENLADRLAQLNGLEIPRLSLSDDADSGNVTSDEKRQPAVEKIILKCPRASFLELNTDFHCSYCTESFCSNRELKKHIKAQHRQRLVIKITKTDANKHVTHMVEPVLNPRAKQSESYVDKGVEEQEESEMPAVEKVIDELPKANDTLDEQITEGEIKIIVKKESGSRNSHVVKEIKITPKASDSSRFPSASPAKSDLSGGGSYRMSRYSPACSDVIQQPPVKRGPGRPRKYPIFSHTELIVKHLASQQVAAAMQQAPVDATPVAPTRRVINNGGIISKTNIDKEPLFKPVESIIESLESERNSQQNVEKKSRDADARPKILSKMQVMEDGSVIHRPRVGRKRKRARALSLDNNTQMGKNAVEEAEAVVQEEKKRKEDIEEEATYASRSVSEPDLRVKHSIVKELVVRLTKIDSVPKVSTDVIANVVNDVERSEDNSVPKVVEKRKRGRPPKIKSIQILDTNSQREPIKAVIRLNLKKKLENNNNNVNELEKCVSISKGKETAVPSEKLEVRETKVQTEWKTTANAVAEGSEELIEGTKEQVELKLPEAEAVGISTVENEALLPSLDDNQKTFSEAQLVVTPQHQAQDKVEVIESQKAKHPMLMNALTPYETTNNLVDNTAPITTVESSPQIIQTQSQPHPQLLLQQQPQQFCILFIPDTLYSSDPSVAKDATPTATIVNFQPVPDSEIANKPLIFTPTTPTKITHEEPVKSFVCPTCTEVSDLIGRLEASLGMTEEDKSAIKCPYCSNHFQSLFYLEYHVRQEHLKCENEKQCKHSGFNSLRIPNHETASEFEVYITFALKCRSCYDIFNTVLLLNDHVMHKHKNLVRLKPSLTASSSSSMCMTPYPLFMRKNGSRAPAVLQCPSDCVCRIGIRQTDSPLQRQQMLRRCPNAMRRLEKIEPAAYEVYTCTLCKSTFLMKDEVVDHLMKMHEVSCKFPCYTCLTSFRTLQIQENHHCSEKTLQDLDKLLNIAILPANVGGKEDNNKYLEREDSSTDEYGTIKSVPAEQPVISAPVAVAVAGPIVGAVDVGSAAPAIAAPVVVAAPPAVAAPPPPAPAPTPDPSQSSSAPEESPKNGFKRKNGTALAMINLFLGVNLTKKPRLTNGQPPAPMRKRRKNCPKCGKKFVYRKSLYDHIISEHILKGEGDEGTKKAAAELLSLVYTDRATGQQAEQLAQLLERYVDQNGVLLRNFVMANQDEQENWEEPAPMAAKEVLNKKDLTQCARCKAYFKSSANSGNLARLNNHKAPGSEPTKLQLCEKCENGGPKTRRRSIVNNGHHNSADTSSPQIIHSFACKKCPKTFPTAVELKAHKRSVHAKALNDKLQECNMCKKVFASSRMLEKHKKVHHDSMLDDSAKTEEDEHNQSRSSVVSKDSEANDSLTDKANSSSRRDSSDSNAGSKEPEEQLLNCTFCEEVCSSKVSLKNHLKREHGRRASICQFCNGLLIDTSEVRHMLDYHIVPTKSNPRRTTVNGNVFHCDESSCMQEDVEELIRILGKHRLQSLMMYYDFEGKCNNAIMKCPICPELFATRESCRFHYVWIHDDNCLLCDETFRSGSIACQHKIDAHTSTASYLWCIQRLVTAIVNTLRLDPNQPSHVLYQILVMRLEDEERQMGIESESSIIPRCVVEKTTNEEATTSADRFLEEVVLSEDQLPDSGNMIEVVIGKEDSEDDLLSMLNLSPNYEGCEQTKLPNAGAAPPEEEDDEDTMSSTPPMTPLATTAAATAAAASTTPTAASVSGSPVIENYVTSGVCKYKLDNDEEQLVLVVTDDDLVTYRDDIESLAERISATCDSLTLEEITEMLRAYFESVNMSVGTGA